ncbi:MAG: ATP-binding protein [Oligoflexales bacterium]
MSYAGIESLRDFIETTINTQELIIDNVPFSVMIITPDGYIIKCNKSCLRFFSASLASQIVGKNVKDFVNNSVYKFISSKMKLDIDSATNFSYIDRSERVHDMWLMIKRPFAFAEPIFIIIRVDIREIQQIYEDFLLQITRGEAIVQLTAGIAHEINNPLTILRLALERIYEMDESTDLIKNITQKCLNSMNRISDIIAILSGNLGKDSNAEFGDVNAIVLNTIKLKSRQFNQEDLQIEIDLDNEDLICQMSQSDLFDVLTQVLDNAIDSFKEFYSPNKSIIVKTRQTDKNTIEILVKDNGIGIKKDNLDKVFNPFYTTKEVGTGMGLGLFVVIRKMMKFGGTVDILSEPEKGTSVYLKLLAKT